MDGYAWAYEEFSLHGCIDYSSISLSKPAKRSSAVTETDRLGLGSMDLKPTSRAWSTQCGPTLSLNFASMGQPCMLASIVKYFIQLLQHFGPTNSDKRYARISIVERTLLTALTRPRSAIIPYRGLHAAEQADVMDWLCTVLRECGRTPTNSGGEPIQPLQVFSTAGSSTIRLNHLHHPEVCTLAPSVFLSSVPKQP